MSADDVIFCEPLENFAGLCVENRSRPIGDETVVVGGETLPIVSSYYSVYSEAGGKVLLRDNKGNPVMSCMNHGKGKVYFVSFPIENNAADMPHLISGDKEIAYENFYKMIPEARNSDKKIYGDNPYVGVTEHPEKEGRKAVLVNYRPMSQTVKLKYENLEFVKIIGDAETEDGLTFKIPANSGAVLVFK